MTTTSTTTTPTIDLEETVRQQIGASALKLFRRAQRQNEQTNALFEAANRLFREANRDRAYGDRLYGDEMSECSFRTTLEKRRREYEEEGDELALESLRFIDFLITKALDAMPDVQDDYDEIRSAFEEDCVQLAKAMKANLDAGIITGESAVRARKFICHNLRQPSVLN